MVKDLKEKDLVLEIALKLRDRIKSAMPVVMTRQDDTFVTLDDRVVDAVDWHGALFVSIHANKVRDKNRWGAVVYSYGPQPRRHRAGRRRRRRRHLRHKVPPMPAPPRVDARESEYLAGSMVRSLRGEGIRVEEAKADYYVLKNPAQPSILIELGYISNAAEEARLKDPAYQEKLVDAMAKAIEEYDSDRSLRAENAAVAPAQPPARL
ncbi:MAG TPA: N-acetylmuramoyl-L-alanine amidase, partial [Elusimicrobiota bacterium]|jgi:N-acetylmuramoyl-L-alanine amidase|nr:N-acetylmuramoyl-L-alanine amidase [Elusimicrobiota bacterium]